MDCPVEIPPFRPHPLLKNRHAQTFYGALTRGYAPRYRARQHRIELADGDCLVLHDDCPPTWQTRDRAALLLHGFVGCHNSPYLPRITHKLTGAGCRVFRLDQRGHGAGAALARQAGHAGRTEDAAAALAEIERLCPGSPCVLVGFSLGGNMALRLLGLWGAAAPPMLVRAMAIAPPIELRRCALNLRRGMNPVYDRSFTRRLVRFLRYKARIFPEYAALRLAPPPRTVLEFDQRITGPHAGFGTANRYYRQSSAAPVLERIAVPTLILSACDDPLIPPEIFARARVSPHVAIHLTECGGHMGFVSDGSAGDPDRRWMDWRVVDWVTAAYDSPRNPSTMSRAERTS